MAVGGSIWVKVEIGDVRLLGYVPRLVGQEDVGVVVPVSSRDEFRVSEGSLNG